MNLELKSAVEAQIFENTGRLSRIISQDAVHGGCINSTEVIKFDDRRSFFLKTNSSAPDDIFEREAECLRALSDVDAIKVPEVVGIGRLGSTKFLILELIESQRQAASFSELFGRQIAVLHRTASNDRFGFSNNNYLGSSVQPNEWNTDWVEFWCEHRLGFQFELARSNGYADQAFNRMADELLGRLDEIISTSEPPSLIHGDLWSGNFLAGRAGEPVLIDPAVYYGHREAEFGMTTLFGGFNAGFYASYNEVWPLESGSEERIEIYRLYHLLNHLNLFGNSYRSQCVEIMKKYSPVH